MRFAKPPIPVSDQIALLRARGMEIPDPHAAAHYLSHISYYRLTSYWLPFEADHATNEFRRGTAFPDVLDLYIFDRELRLHVIDAIERVEVSVRTQWMNVLVQAHGPHAHLDSALFRTATNRAGAVVWAHGKAVAALKEECARSREIFIAHLRSKYEEELPPLWATCELMTLGEFSKWFANTKSSASRNAVSRAYGLDESFLVSFLHHLTIVRNLCAHHARLWNREFTVRWRMPTKNPRRLVDGINPHRPGTIYNTLVMLAYLMEIISPDTLWKARLLRLVAAHGIDVGRMGFPEDFLDRSLWKEGRA